ncbi:toll/interleukin-1 receptor domain-containing protein [uncultured Thiodictyon sp.]|uniref:toll/interleukin-1 receptor domain-containing protein n=1 Tax=uncultured Thiodictyon sp. TaxID=1846217 RepID=UPI0025D73CB5|nr:toll/interleukin-1 receptor domain-containing protein [uncultured Thiodictyon sp.]
MRDSDWQVFCGYYHGLLEDISLAFDDPFTPTAECEHGLRYGRGNLKNIIRLAKLYSQARDHSAIDRFCGRLNDILFFNSGSAHRVGFGLVESRGASKVKVFISHSSKDEAIAMCLIELIRAALRLDETDIRCTSVNGYRLPIGASTDAELRREINDADVFIGLISEASMASGYVMFELGARWGANKYLAPILAPGCDTGILAGPIKGVNTLRCDQAAHLHQLVADLSRTLDCRTASPASYQKYIDQLVAP